MANLKAENGQMALGGPLGWNGKGIWDMGIEIESRGWKEWIGQLERDFGHWEGNL
jgi:hypothetical protein